jgi:hypothetical protein
MRGVSRLGALEYGRIPAEPRCLQDRAHGGGRPWGSIEGGIFVSQKLGLSRLPKCALCAVIGVWRVLLRFGRCAVGRKARQSKSTASMVGQALQREYCEYGGRYHIAASTHRYDKFSDTAGGWGFYEVRRPPAWRGDACCAIQQ